MTTKAFSTETQKLSPDSPSKGSWILKRVWPPTREFLVQAIGQPRIYRKGYPGVMHALIFWGMTIQVVGTAINLMQIPLFVPFIELPFPRGDLYLGFELIMDLAGVAILVGTLMALFRRLVLRPETLDSHWEDYFALGLLLLIALVGFTLEGIRLLAVPPEWAGWSPVGNAMAGLLGVLGMSTQTAWAWHPYLYWIHILLALALVASIPFTKLRHLVTGPLNIVLRPLRREGVLEPIENIEEAEILGVGRVTEFTPQQLLSFDACVRCGRCVESCPVSSSGMSFSPRDFIQGLRTVMNKELLSSNGSNLPAPLDEQLPEEAPWLCTTCGGCLESCPMFINPVTEVIDLRRYLVLTTGKIPNSVADTLRNLGRQGNPWGLPPEERTTWAEGLGVRAITPGDETDVLLFLGCAGAYDSRNRKAARSFVRILQKAGIDFAILGIDEGCCGETARRLGHEYLFQVFAEQNIETLGKYTFKRIVTQCPHCFNTLKNEYPQFGGDYQVLHYTDYLAELAAQGGMEWPDDRPIRLDGRLTYHDSCYLGRYNQIFQAPRALLDRVGLERVEMEHRLKSGFCCGGGGGQMWMETDPNNRINHRRLEEALDVEAGVVATACPYCLLMFDDAIRSKGLGDQVQVMDIAEILSPTPDTEASSETHPTNPTRG